MSTRRFTVIGIAVTMTVGLGCAAAVVLLIGAKSFRQGDSVEALGFASLIALLTAGQAISAFIAIILLAGYRYERWRSAVAWLGCSALVAACTWWWCLYLDSRAFGPEK